MLDAWPKVSEDNGPGNFRVTVKGTVSAGGVMTLSSIEPCEEGADCDGGCVGEGCGMPSGGASNTDSATIADKGGRTPAASALVVVVVGAFTSVF